MENSSKRDLINLGLIKETRLEQIALRVRDRADIGVLRDSESGIIFLERTDHMDIEHYEQVEGGSYWGARDRAEALEKYREDDERRATQFREILRDKRVIDVGCGTGGFMDRVKDVAKSVAGAEPQTYIRRELERSGYEMYRIPEEAPQEAFDVATLFHVLEHITTPLQTLKATRELLRTGGSVIIEVPHARDALLELKSFRDFSFWSEHLILHTKRSLHTYLEKAGFKNIEIQGFQRYPLANHAGWLAYGEPGGQNKLPEVQTKETAKAYATALQKADRTDTLIAIAEA